MIENELLMKLEHLQNEGLDDGELFEELIQLRGVKPIYGE